MTEDVLALADRFFAAIEAGDVKAVRAIYHPDVVVWHNYDPLEERDTGDSREDNLKVLEGLPKRISGARYEVWHREATETGFVQQHVLTGTMPNGKPFVLPACIVCRVENGRITRLDEYFDPAIRDRLYAAVQEAERG
ncbi:MAG: nuclear transport factor 2 family protein [Alphaproteobacteria bacterium]